MILIYLFLNIIAEFDLIECTCVQARTDYWERYPQVAADHMDPVAHYMVFSIIVYKFKVKVVVFKSIFVSKPLILRTHL